MLTLLLLVRSVGCAAHADTEMVRATSDPEAAAELVTQAIRAYHSGDQSKATQAFESALREDRGCIAAYNGIGVIELERSGYYRAAWAFQRAVDLDPSDPRPKNNLALVLERTGKLADARDMLEDAAQSPAAEPDVLFNLARIKVRLGEYDYRLRQLLEAVENTPGRPERTNWAQREIVKAGWAGSD